MWINNENFTVEKNVFTNGDFRVITKLEGYEYRIAFVTDKNNKSRIFMADNFSLIPIVLTHEIPTDYSIDFFYPDLDFTLGEIYDNNIKEDALTLDEIIKILDADSINLIKKLWFEE